MVGRWIMGLNYFVKNVCICDYIRLQTFVSCELLTLPYVPFCGVPLLLDGVPLLLDGVPLLLYCVVFVPRNAYGVPLYAWHVVLYFGILVIPRTQ